MARRAQRAPTDVCGARWVAIHAQGRDLLPEQSLVIAGVREVAVEASPLAHGFVHHVSSRHVLVTRMAELRHRRPEVRADPVSMNRVTHGAVSIHNRGMRPLAQQEQLVVRGRTCKDGKTPQKDEEPSVSSSQEYQPMASSGPVPSGPRRRNAGYPGFRRSIQTPADVSEKGSFARSLCGSTGALRQSSKSSQTTVRPWRTRRQAVLPRRKPPRKSFI